MEAIQRYNGCNRRSNTSDRLSACTKLQQDRKKQTTIFLSFLRSSNTSVRRKRTISTLQHQLPPLQHKCTAAERDQKLCDILATKLPLKDKGRVSRKLSCSFGTGHWLKKNITFFKSGYNSPDFLLYGQPDALGCQHYFNAGFFRSKFCA